MFGPLGVPELLFILALALLVFGPRRLPEVGRTLGRSLAEFRKATTDLRRSINAEMLEEELRASDPRKIARETLEEISRPEPEAGESDDPRPEPRRPPEGTAARGRPEARTETEPVKDRGDEPAKDDGAEPARAVEHEAP